MTRARKVTDHNGCSSLKTQRNAIKFALNISTYQFSDHALSVDSSAALWPIKIVSSGRFKRKLQRIQTAAAQKERHYFPVHTDLLRNGGADKGATTT